MRVTTPRTTPKPVKATQTGAVQAGHAAKTLKGKTASGNTFGVSVSGVGRDSNGNMSYDVKVRYDDAKGLFDGAANINVNATASLVSRTFGKNGKVSSGGQQATGSALQRVGAHTFEGIVHVPLLGKKGEFREDVSAMALTFGQLTNNSWQGAKFDGNAYQEYTVPLKLKGPE